MVDRRSRRNVVPLRQAFADLRLRPTTLIMGVALLALAGVLIFVMNRDVTSTSPPNTSRISRQPPRPAFTPAEEGYIREVWPIHGDVERSTMRMSLGQIFYKTQDLGRAELRTRVEQALAVYQRAEARLRALEPPMSLRREHEEYLSALRLFRESASEVLRMFEDGRDDHMRAAYPKSQEGSDKIREVGGKFWPNEFPPN
jgi:hypothetical protein